MHGASIGAAGTGPGPGPLGNRAPRARRSLYVMLTMTMLIGQVQ